MSQNATLDRETVRHSLEEAPFAELLEERLPVTLARREHLMLLDWERRAPEIAPQAHEWTAVRPVRRACFGWYEACILLLLAGSGVAAVFSLLHLG